MNVLSKPDKKDRILDPCCGTGTILIERLLLKPACEIVGIDIDPGMIEYARQNAKAAGVEITFKHGDIKDQHFPSNYFTKIITNLPFGIHSLSRQENINLYRFIAISSERWLTPGGKVIVLTTSKKILWNAFATIQRLKFIQETEINIGNLQASIFIYQKV